MEIDGLTINEIKWNIYAFGRKVNEFARKRDVARKEHTRAMWQKKFDEYAIYLTNNQTRLARANAAEQSVQLTGGTLPDLQALSQPEDLSGLEADTIPPTSN